MFKNDIVYWVGYLLIVISSVLGLVGCRLFAVFAFQIWPRSETPSTLSWHTNSLMHAFGIFYFIFFTDWAYSKWDGQPAKLALLLFQNSNLLGKPLMRQWHFPLTTTPFVHLPNGQVISRFNRWMFVLFILYESQKLNLPTRQSGRKKLYTSFSYKNNYWSKVWENSL